MEHGNVLNCAPKLVKELIDSAESRSAARQNIPMQLLLLLGRLGAPLDFAQQPRWLRALVKKLAVWLQQASSVETQMFQLELQCYHLANVEYAPILEELLALRFEHAITLQVPLHLSSLQDAKASRKTREPPTYTTFANSSLWYQQQDFYQKKSLKAWTNNHVPWQISNNGLVTAQYAGRIATAVGTMSDVVHSLAVIELGAGHGQLSLALAELLPTKLPTVATKAIATDFHENVFTEQLRLPWVQSMCQQGLLDFCVIAAQPFDWTCAEADTRSEHGSALLFSGTRLSTALDVDMIVVVGNYAYDSFPVDLVAQTAGRLPYMLCTIDSKNDENLLAVPYMHFKDCGAPAELSNLIEFAGERGRGFHVIPSAALSAFSLVLELASSATKNVMMIAGDCPIFHDDGRWGGHSTLQQLENTPPESRPESIVCSFDLPTISPEKACTAIPVDLQLLAQGFVNCAASNGFIVAAANISPCVLSAFAVVDVLCIRPSTTNDKAANGVVSIAPTLQFGPNELQVLRDAVTDEGYARRSMSLESLYSVLCMCNFDTIFFLEVRFLVLALLHQHSLNSHHATGSYTCCECWALVAVKAFTSQHAVDERSFQQCRQDILQWLQAIRVPQVAISVMAPTAAGLHHMPGMTPCCLPALQVLDADMHKLVSWSVIPLTAWECWHLMAAHAEVGQEVTSELRERLDTLLSDPTEKVRGLKRLKRKLRVLKGK